MALWGLEEGEGPLLSSLLVVLRVPGVLLLDLWWSEHTKDILPEVAEVEAVADMGISLLMLMLVSLVRKGSLDCSSCRPFAFFSCLFKSWSSSIFTPSPLEPSQLRLSLLPLGLKRRSGGRRKRAQKL